MNKVEVLNKGMELLVKGSDIFQTFWHNSCDSDICEVSFSIGNMDIRTTVTIAELKMGEEWCEENGFDPREPILDVDLSDDTVSVNMTCKVPGENCEYSYSIRYKDELIFGLDTDIYPGLIAIEKDNLVEKFNSAE